MKLISNSILLLAAAFSLVSCSYQPEQAGLCKLVCGGSIIGANDSVVSMELMTPVVSTVCGVSAAGSASGPYRTAFLIGEAVLDQNGESTSTRPMPNISIEPLIIGNRANANNENDADSRYQGIVTAKDNWCSDSCGVAILDTMSLCPPPGGSSELSVQIHSGAKFSDPAKFPISTKEPEKTEE
jgi:hypothetical protein